LPYYDRPHSTSSRRSQTATSTVRDPRGNLYDPNRLATHFYLEDPPRDQGHPDLARWKSLSTKWNRKHNSTIGSGMIRPHSPAPGPDDRHPHRPASSSSNPQRQPHLSHSHRASSGKKVSPQQSEGPIDWVGPLCTPKTRTSRSRCTSRTAKPHSSAASSAPSVHNSRWFASMSPRNFQVTPDIIKENLECDRLLRTAAWEHQAAETALSLCRYKESDQHLQRASTLQQAAESLSDHLFRKSLSKRPPEVNSKHEMMVVLPLLYDGSFSRPYNVDTIKPMQ